MWMGVFCVKPILVDAFTCLVQRSLSAVPRRGRMWSGSACCWAVWRTAWCPPLHLAVLCWWPEDRKWEETVFFLCVISPKVHYTPAAPSLIYFTPVCLKWPISWTLHLSIRALPPASLTTSLAASVATVSASPASALDCVWLSLNVPSRLNERGLSMGATKQQCDEVFPLDCSHMVRFAAWQKENRGVH